jgi:hypothetical protein
MMFGDVGADAEYIADDADRVRTGVAGSDVDLITATMMDESSSTIDLTLAEGAEMSTTISCAALFSGFGSVVVRVIVDAGTMLADGAVVGAALATAAFFLERTFALLSRLA